MFKQTPTATQKKNLMKHDFHKYIYLVILTGNCTYAGLVNVMYI